MHGTKISVFSPLTKEACHKHMACMKTIWKCKQSWKCGCWLTETRELVNRSKYSGNLTLCVS